MKEKTKKILKCVGLSLGAFALLAVGVGVGACSVKYGLTQPTTTTPIRKGLKKLESDNNLFNATYSIAEKTIGSSVGNSMRFEKDDYWNTYCWTANEMPTGLYRISGEYPSGWNALWGGFCAELMYDRIVDLEAGSIQTFDSSYFSESFLVSGSSLQVNRYFYLEWGEFDYFIINCRSDTPLYISLVDPSDDINEKLVLNASYDFRRWFGNVDPTTGLIQYSLGSGVSVVNIRVGGLLWKNLGNGRLYNVIEFTLQPLQSANAFLVSDNLAKTASSLYGDNLNQFAMVSNVYYSYQSGYDGAYSVLTDTALPSVVYRDRVYTFPFVTAQLDGTNNNVNAIDVRNCVIPSIYRTFGIVEDSGVIFSTNGYSSVTLRQLLGMDFSSVVNYSEGTASAFSLLTQAFGSVAGLLAVQVLPNITLGLLMFLPLIAAVIVLIIKAVKK